MTQNILEKQQLNKTENFIRSEFESEGSGHDWWHIYRVRKMALKIAEKEGGDIFLIEISALLHDLDDWKINSGKHLNKTKKWLEKIGVNESQQDKILQIIDEVSFKGAGVETKANSKEAQIVQDADRLDAIGAIGIARTFAYGGNKNRLIYHPDIKPTLHQSFDDYKKTTAPTINHFYEKLLLLKNRLNTNTAIAIAENRHKFMEDFLTRFFDEWEGKK